MGTSSPDTVSRAGHVDATAGDAVEVDDHGDAVALAVELLLEERDRVIDGGADIGIVDDGLGRRTASRRSVRPPRPQSRSPNNPTVIELGRFMMLNASGVVTGGAPSILLLVIENRLVFLAEPLDQLA
jgi:hypothetical protein